jgi:hypothetical protein
MNTLLFLLLLFVVGNIYVHLKLASKYIDKLDSLEKTVFSLKRYIELKIKK